MRSIAPRRLSFITTAVSFKPRAKQDQAFELFRQAAKKDPNDWVVHDGTARIYSSKGDYGNALKEIKITVAGAPENQKIFFEPLVKKLEAGQDINKN